MHVAGCPGSHVVIRSQDDDLPEETVRDAAALTAKYSKAPQKGKVRVSLVRCRQVGHACLTSSCYSCNCPNLSLDPPFIVPAAKS